MAVAEALKLNVSDELNAVEGDVPEVLPRIYDEPINVVVLKRELTATLSQYCDQLTAQYPNFQLRSIIKTERATRTLTSLLPELDGKADMVEDLALLVDMYGCLFELDEVGVRLEVLDRAMCPRFHTDKLGCRLVSTYKGAGTEWLSNKGLDRSKLGAGNNGLPDHESGLYPLKTSVKQVSEGDIVLLKGDGWFGNDGQGAVHRSPQVLPDHKRVVVTLDFA